MKACNSCGKCCIKYGHDALSASDEDLAIWESIKPNIFRYTRDGNLWVDPVSGHKLTLCPWLRKAPNQVNYTCAIYFERPEDCRVYPANVQEMLNDQCEMLEAKDLANLKHAQAVFEMKFSSE